MCTRREILMPVLASMFILGVFGCGRKPLPDSFFFNVSENGAHRLPGPIVVEAARRTMGLDEAFWLEFCTHFPGHAPFVISEGRPHDIDDTSWALIEPQVFLPKDLTRENRTSYESRTPGYKWTEPSMWFASRYPEFYENVQKRPILMRRTLYRKLRNLLYERHLKWNAIDSAGRTEP